MVERVSWTNLHVSSVRPQEVTAERLAGTLLMHIPSPGKILLGEVHDGASSECVYSSVRPSGGIPVRSLDILRKGAMLTTTAPIPPFLTNTVLKLCGHLTSGFVGSHPRHFPFFTKREEFLQGYLFNVHGRKLIPVGPDLTDGMPLVSCHFAYMDQRLVCAIATVNNILILDQGKKYTIERPLIQQAIVLPSAIVIHVGSRLMAATVKDDEIVGPFPVVLPAPAGPVMRLLYDSDERLLYAATRNGAFAHAATEGEDGLNRLLDPDHWKYSIGFGGLFDSELPPFPAGLYRGQIFYETSSLISPQGTEHVQFRVLTLVPDSQRPGL